MVSCFTYYTRLISSSHRNKILFSVRANLSWNFNWTFYKYYKKSETLYYSINWFTFYTSLNKFFTPVRDYSLILYEFHFDILITKVRKIIKMWDLGLWSQLFYFLHMFDLFLHIVKNYSLLLHQIPLEISIELLKKKNLRP
jgi:hypothetical protein